jgi:hypothetical protein
LAPLSADQIAELNPSEVEELELDERKTAALESKDQKARAASGYPSQNWVNRRRDDAGMCSVPARKALNLRLAVLGQARIDMVAAAQKPLLAAKFKRNGYPKKCAACRAEVDADKGWMHYERKKGAASAEWVTRCHECSWKLAVPAAQDRHKDPVTAQRAGAPAPLDVPMGAGMSAKQ